MITIYSSSDQNALLEKLAKDLKKYQNSLFQPVSLISAGFLQDLWVKEEIAKLNGIIANVRSYRPDRFISWLDFILSENESPEKYSLHQLEWIYFSQMGSSEFRSRFPDLNTYYGEDQVKRFAFAQHAVQLLDKYQDFRAELIQEWRRNSKLTTSDWQEYLFVKALHDHSDFIPDKSEWPSRIKSKIEKEESKFLLKKQVPVLYIFGSFSISPKFLEVLHILKNEITIHWYRVDFDPQHPIAKNWAEGSLRNGSALSEMFGSHSIQILDDQARAGHENSSLSKIQHALAVDRPISLTIEELKSDSSLEFHVCHTKIREVESLYNYLVRLLEFKQDIGARDIQVFVPDLDAYIAPIRTVFDTAPLSFPYRILSGGYSHEESFWSALIQLLSIDSDQFTATHILELIEAKAIRERFGFEDLELIRKMMSDANMARGYSGNEETETRFYSLEYGLKRLMYGYLLGKNQFAYHDGEEELFTVDSAEGKQAEDLFRLYEFVSNLHQVLIHKDTPKDLNSWLEWVSSLADQFLWSDPQTERKFQHLLQEIGLVEGFVKEAIDFKTFSFRLIHLLEEMDGHGVAGFGGIIFSQLIPGRVLPKKVILMMGMNFREFPRTAKAPSFDKLMQGEKKLLDPNPRISDQSTFLEALFAAKEAFYISYIGKSDQDNATIPASTVVEELIGLVASITGTKEKDFVISHPLHSFSVQYNRDNDTKLKNYLIQKEQGEEFKSASESNGLDLKEVLLSQLKSFFKDPFKYYYNQVLGIYYSDQRHQLDNRERFDSDGLNDWLIKDRLLRSPDFSSKLHRKELLAEGLLPLRNVGVAILDRLGVEMEELHVAYTKLLPVETRQLTLQLEGITLNGQVNFGSDSRLLFVTPSKTEKKRKYLIEVALDYLFGVATGAGSDLHVLSLDKKDFWSQKIGQQEAKEKLAELTKIFITHLDRRFVYTPDINLDKILNEPSPNSLQEARVQVIKDCRSEYGSVSEYIKREESIGFFEEDTSIQSLLTSSRIMSEIFKPFF